MTTCEYITKFEDYKAGQRLFMRCNRGARYRFWSWMFGLPLLTLLLVLELHFGRQKAGDWLPGVTLVVAACTFATVILRPWNLRQAFKKRKKVAGMSTNTRTQFSFDDDGVISAIPGRSESRFQWTALKRFAEDSSIALLFISDKCFFYIPKRAMTAEQWDQLRRIVSAKGIG